MADKVKNEATSSFDVETFKAVVRSINAEKEKASEHVGRAGQATKDAIDRHNYNRKALTFIAGLAKKDPGEQAEVMSAVMTYAHGMGMFDTTDMFDPAIHAMRKIVTDIEAGKSGRPSEDSAIARMTAATTH